MYRRLPWFVLVICCAATVSPPREASAWGIGSQLHLPGCHETITAGALRGARAMWPTAPIVRPSRDEAALIDGVQFEPPADFVNDLGGMSMLLGVRDNDLKGNNPLDSLQLVEVHGDPFTQSEHCIRTSTDDGEEGNVSALNACRAFIVQRATEALDSLGADGIVDSSSRMELPVYVSFAGKVKPKLPAFYVKMGQALHALEDGFTHTYRTPDGMRVTYVTNWIDNVTGSASNEERDGPPHHAGMDRCQSTDPVVQRNYQNATAAATEILKTALSPMMTREQKIAEFDALTAKWLSYQPGCTTDNDYCAAPEPAVADPTACNAGRGATPWAMLLIIGAVALSLRRRQLASYAALGVVIALGAPAYAQNPPAPTPAPAPDPNAPPKADEAPAVPVVPEKVEDVKDAQEGKEPGRDVSTPTVEEVKEVREDKRLGSKFGFAGSIGGSVISGAGVIVLGARYRMSERWVFGLDAEWNPWVTSVPLEVKAGAASAYFTVIRRFPMKFDRVNLRTSLHLGASTLLFDVTGAPKGSFGPYAAFTPLGIDYDLGGTVRFVLDPVQISVPVPHLGPLPLYYEQFRLMLGIQIGA